MIPVATMLRLCTGSTRNASRDVCQSLSWLAPKMMIPTGSLDGRKYTTDGRGETEEAIPPTADVVIIGGGVIGCSALYHLAKMGMTNTVLLEKAQLTAGTTWHTAGLVWSLRPSDTEVQLLHRSIELMETLEEETGVNPGWINNGGLFIASTKERLDEYKRLMTLGRAFDTEAHVLTPAETKQLYPLMNVADVYGSLYSPADGTIDPAGYCTALARAATNLGARVVSPCGVTGARVETDDYGTRRVTGVYTDRGTIRTSVIVNCAGVWARAVGRPAGVEVPLVAMKHAYVVTEKIDGIQHMPNVRDHDASVYLKLQGDALCVGGYEQNPVFWEKVEDEFAFSLFELDWDVFSSNIQGAINRVPAIEKTGVKSTVCGPESFTADHKPLMGETPEVRGYYLGCGFNSSGMMLSGGCGEQLAKWVMDGRPELDMYSYDIRRFPVSLTANSRWLRERSHEAYAKNYSIVYPHDEPLAGRNMRRDALHQVLKEAGCIFQERHGWERPGWFNLSGPAVPEDYDYYGQYGHQPNSAKGYIEHLKMDYTFDFPPHHRIIGNECVACREKAALFNMSYFGKYYLVGRDAPKAADWLFSNDVRKDPGSTVYSCMLNRRGGVEADLTVSVLSPGTDTGPHDFDGRGFYVAVGGGLAQHALGHMQDVLADSRLDCRLVDVSETMAMLSVQGPRSRQILQSLTDADLSDAAFPFSSHKVVEVAGHGVRAMRLTFVGELGWELHVPSSSAVEVYQAVMEAGAQYGLINAGYRAIDSLSIEKGYRHWHEDLRADDTPLESGLAFTCKLKSDVAFLGREALERQKKEGVRKRIACFTVDKHVPLHGLEAIKRDGKVAGFIRRADYAHALDKSIAYGYVTRDDGEAVTMDYLRSGTYQLEHMGELVAATLHTKSPFDPSNERVKGRYGLSVGSQ
ncbi:hypothetical protein NP493_127g01000 [Ridgeia piscesae]|uniref:Sarcosine dehydrogenase n=1 Tax=Ridgeia piscesae TaxID=27915 RepID=A0AAD9P5V3_RIDPI|nr:hypothetical protein NP493_127g01000 [Ridgeia piscesae]